MMEQKNIFKRFEGDQWFQRNSMDCLLSPDMSLIKKYSEEQKGNLLEIGCSGGNKLNQVKGQMNGYGIDPSKEAIVSGLKNHHDLNLQVGTADNLPFEDSAFKIVIFGFCLYLVDRSLLLKSISEADRVLQNKGLMIITDFDPDVPTKRKYHHSEGIFTYKQSYQAILLALPYYSEVEKISYAHQSSNFHNNPQERIATTVLYKDFDSGYADI